MQADRRIIFGNHAGLDLEGIGFEADMPASSNKTAHLEEWPQLMLPVSRKVSLSATTTAELSANPVSGPSMATEQKSTSSSTANQRVPTDFNVFVM